MRIVGFPLDPGRGEGAERLPWDADRAAPYRTIFPQMVRALPEEAGEQLRFAFETEMARLEAA